MDERPHILIVDDEESIRSALMTLLGRAGFTVQVAATGADGIALVQANPPALILLDVVLNEADVHALTGLDVLRAVRSLERFIPVIMLTSYTEWQIESLGLGAIAFMTKPWDAAALLTQIRTTLNAVMQIRRDALAHVAAGNIPPSNLRIGDLEIDTLHYRVLRAGQSIDLTPIEFALLTFLVRHPGREWTRDALLDQVWGHEWVGYDRTVDRHIAAIRRKLRLQRDELIETVHGTGYRFTATSAP